TSPGTNWGRWAGGRPGPAAPAARRRAPSARRGEDQWEDPFAARPAEQAGGDGEGPAGVGVVVHEQDGARSALQGVRQLLGDAEGAGERPESLGGVAAACRVRPGRPGVRQSAEEGEA